MEHLEDEGERELEARLLGTTAKIPWVELQRFFARGRVLNVAEELNLIEVASKLIEDDAEQFQAWVKAEQVMHVSDETAQHWLTEDKTVWATVVAPWVLVKSKELT